MMRRCVVACVLACCWLAVSVLHAEPHFCCTMSGRALRPRKHFVLQLTKPKIVVPKPSSNVTACTCQSLKCKKLHACACGHCNGKLQPVAGFGVNKGGTRRLKSCLKKCADNERTNAVFNDAKTGAAAQDKLAAAAASALITGIKVVKDEHLLAIALKWMWMQTEGGVLAKWSKQQIYYFTWRARWGDDDVTVTVNERTESVKWLSQKGSNQFFTTADGSNVGQAVLFPRHGGLQARIVRIARSFYVREVNCIEARLCENDPSAFKCNRKKGGSGSPQQDGVVYGVSALVLDSSMFNLKMLPYYSLRFLAEARDNKGGRAALSLPAAGPLPRGAGVKYVDGVALLGGTKVWG